METSDKKNKSFAESTGKQWSPANFHFNLLKLQNAFVRRIWSKYVLAFASKIRIVIGFKNFDH